MRAYQRSWHQVDLTALAPAPDAPAGPELYQQFYAELDEGRGAQDQHWRSTKRTLGEEVACNILDRWEQRFGRKPRILALAVGLGTAEGVWLERGCDVTLHDCQETSLRRLRRRFPEAPVMIADLRAIEIPPGFDIVVMLASEYILSDGELDRFMQVVKGSLSENGRLVLHSVSILSMLRLSKQWVKRLSGYHTGGIFWGWLRTPAELARSARSAGFRVETAYRVGVQGSDSVLYERSALLKVTPTLHDESVVFVLS